MMPKRIQRKRAKGSRLPAKTLCVTRPSLLCNPYSVAEFGELALPLFRNTARGVWNPSLVEGWTLVEVRKAYQSHVNWLKRFMGRHPLDVIRTTLPNYDFIACWCPLDQPCHADILLELANQ